MTRRYANLALGVLLGCGPADDAEELEAASLFACAPALTCDPITTETGHEPVDAVECATRLASEGGAGVVEHTTLGGPDADDEQALIVFMGDGTALRQLRHRTCADEACTEAEVAWGESEALQQCDVAVPAEIAEACACDPQVDLCGSCNTVQWLDEASCAPADPVACDDLGESS
jgi:hypothetical protein